MTSPFNVKEFPGSIQINEKIGIGDDCSSSIAYGLLSSEYHPNNEYNGKEQRKWIRHERLSLIDIGKQLGCLVKDVYYTIVRSFEGILGKTLRIYFGKKWLDS